MATIIQRPAAYNFAGNIRDLILTSSDPVQFEIEDLLSEQYFPDSAGRVTIPLRAFFEAHLHAPGPSDIPEQGLALTTYNYSLDGTSAGCFYVLPGGVASDALDAEIFLYSNFLSWQSQTRYVSYYEPQYLRYVAVVASVVKVTAHFVDKTTQTITLRELEGNTLHQLDCNYGRIRGLFEQQPTYYDVCVEAADGSRLSFAQRYVLREDDSDTSDFFVFENSLGGFDTIRFTGDRKEVAESESRNAVFDSDTCEYGVDYSKSWLKQTGYIPDQRTRLWVLEFFSSAQRYHLAIDSLQRIFVSKPKLEATLGEAGGYEFTFAYSHQSKYLNIERGDLPELLEVIGPGDELFFLAPRLNEFPLLDPTADILIPAQYAYNKKWGAIPASALKGNGSGNDSGIVGKLKARQPIRLDVTPGATYITHDAPLVEVEGGLNRYGNVDQWGHLTEDFHPHGGRDDVDLQGRHLTASGDITAGGNIQTEEFASGPTGVGGRIDQKGNGELHSLVLRMFLETPELRKNKISVVGDEFWVTAAGLIESVQKASTLPVYTKSGRQIMGKNGKPWMLNVGKGYVVRFKLEEGEVHTFKKDDILVSKFDQPDGFQTAWFRVKYVLTDREVFVSALNDYAPQVAMSVARQGNFTDPERQNSIYIDGRNGYMRVLSGVNDTEIRFENIRCQYGNLNGLTVPGIGSLHGYGEYSDNAFKKGVFLMQGGATVEDFVKDAIAALAQDVGGRLDGFGLTEAALEALNGKTIISGGFIDTSLINVDTLVAQTALVDRLIASEAFIDKLVARAISTQQGDNPQRVEIKKGEDAVRVYDRNGRNTLSMTTDGGRFPQFICQMADISSVMDIFKIQHKIGSMASTMDQYGFRTTNGEDVLVSLDRNAGLTLPAWSNVNIGSGSSINMPGVLAAGRVLSKGQIGSQWGCKRCGATKYNGQTGKYKITHNIGHVNYFVQATPCGTDNTWAKVHAIILEKTINYAVVAIYDSGTNNTGIDTDFEFLIVGNN